MTYGNDKDGKEVVVISEYVVYVHKCPECGMVFSVTAMCLEHEEGYGKDRWSSMSQTPNYCYMCGSLMDEDVSVEQEANEYYTEDEAADRVYDMEQLREYIYGLDDAIVDGMYKKEYVDTFSNR